MERIGIIDLGSNSIRLIIIDIKENGAHHQIENLKETVRLRSGTDAQGVLTKEGMDSAVEIVSLFVRFCRARKVTHIMAVATAAVRRAPNQKELVDAIWEQTGVTIEVLSSEEEALLGYIGLVNSVTETAGLMAEIGGGALKLVGFENRLPQNSITLDFGAVSLMETYHLNDLPTSENLDALEKFLDETFAQILASRIPKTDGPWRHVSLLSQSLPPSCSVRTRCHPWDHHSHRSCGRNLHHAQRNGLERETSSTRIGAGVLI